MGYPMTWRRLINRNGLGDGDYDTPPTGWRQVAPTTYWDGVRESATAEGATWQDQPVDPVGYVIALSKTVEEHRKESVSQWNGRMSQFAGDLRRLEHDTLDEGLICAEIARKLDFDPEMVAAVLREWLAT